MNCSGVKLWPSAGEAVTFEGRIANRGSAASGAFTYTWYIDGAQSAQASHTSLAAGAEALVTLPWTWATGAHTVMMKQLLNYLLTSWLTAHFVHSILNSSPYICGLRLDDVCDHQAPQAE
jgi:hypothetical protein